MKKPRRSQQEVFFFLQMDNNNFTFSDTVTDMYLHQPLVALLR